MESQTALRASTASTYGMNLRTVSMPGLSETASLTRQSVERPTPDPGATSFLSSVYVSFRSLPRTHAVEGMEDFMPPMLPDEEHLDLAPLQSDEERDAAYRSEVPVNIRKVLWQNLETLMNKAWGRTNLRRLARESGVGVATIARLQGLEQNVGIDMLIQLGKPFRRQAWQLLSPTMGAFSDDAGELATAFDALDEAKKAAAYAVIVQILEFGNIGVLPSAPPSLPPAPAPEKPPAAGRASPASKRTRAKPRRTRQTG